MLRWSINLFRILGIQLAVHVSFLLLIAYFGYEGWQEEGMIGAGWSVLLVLAFFTCVVLHELGHSLTARRYGVHVPRILLMPIGGMAEFDRIPRQPLAEFLITIAGPAVNFALVLLFLPVIWHDLWSEQAVPLHGWENLLINLTAANAVMGTFNLLPVFPMDGGRIFRALLATKLDYLRATFWASMVGRGLALVFSGVAAFYFSNYLLAALFLFIFFAAENEYRHVRRVEEEATYWAQCRARVAFEQALRTESSEEPPAPPIITRGPN